MNQEDTIVALATPVGHSGIGIVRMSGKESFSIARKTFRSPNGSKINWSSTFRIHYGWMVDPHAKEAIDEVLLTLMRAPKTYTREDIVEINCHGGFVPLRRTLELAIKFGARLAHPGEFTRRAFLNGRIDLLQAESILDVVDAKTDQALGIALNGLRGTLSRKIYSFRDAIVELLTCLEAEIEFPDEEIQVPSRTFRKKQIKTLLVQLDSLIEMSGTTRIYREGVRITIIGRSNVGKSTLFNALLERERAIVSSIPGTTRDTIEESINLRGVPLCITDTAGLGKPTGLVDKEGIRRAHFSMDEADVILLVVDGSRGLSREDRVAFQKTKGKAAVILVNKIDLLQKADTQSIRELAPRSLVLQISATKGTNLEKLKEAVSDLILRKIVPSSPPPFLITLRQKNALQETKDSLLRALDAVEKEMPEELIAFDLKEGLKSIGDITGETTGEDVLDRIFSNFCIGK